MIMSAFASSLGVFGHSSYLAIMLGMLFRLDVFGTGFLLTGGVEATACPFGSCLTSEGSKGRPFASFEPIITLYFVVLYFLW